MSDRPQFPHCPQLPGFPQLKGWPSSQDELSSFGLTARGLSSDRSDAEEAKDVVAHALENGAAVLPNEGEYSGGSKAEFFPYKASNSRSSRSSMC